MDLRLAEQREAVLAYRVHAIEDRLVEDALAVDIEEGAALRQCMMRQRVDQRCQHQNQCHRESQAPGTHLLGGGGGREDNMDVIILKMFEDILILSKLKPQELCSNQSRTR